MICWIWLDINFDLILLFPCQKGIFTLSLLIQKKRWDIRNFETSKKCETSKKGETIKKWDNKKKGDRDNLKKKKSETSWHVKLVLCKYKQ